MPLGWQNLDDRMFRDADPQEGPASALPNDSQTVELYSPDGSANVRLLLAGVTVAARIDLTDLVVLDYANPKYVSEGASQTVEFEQPPASRAETARYLLVQRSTHEEHGVFPTGLADA